ncbi:N-acetyltransferase [Micrococcus luteus]|uniref:GNAT family N-acetyltransferase n=1 Tax=Micrococcus endophyticus TaxID=455343 RepID=UPI0010C81E3F|nr:N-acetyltransferase [Micrococcus endophyticus]MCK6091268.1 N-acetyltransferase [Micrococcus endophyticus]QCP06694.1 N-acetyltransferase [Micrococcus luteus]
MSTEQNSTQTPAYRAAHVPAGQDLGHRWSTRVADHEDPADRRAIRQIAELTFESSAEADLVEELAGGGEGWLPQYSLVAMTASIPGTDLQSDPMGYGTLVRAHVGEAEVLALAPHGVLPEHQGEGAGTAIVNALLQKAQGDGEKVVVVYGWPEYYAKFGFRPGVEHGVTAAFADQPEALQVLTLQDDAEVPSGEFRYPPAFGAENAQVAGRA